MDTYGTSLVISSDVEFILISLITHQIKAEHHHNRILLLTPSIIIIIEQNSNNSIIGRRLWTGPCQNRGIHFVYD